jgi:hypothetical protein
MGGMARAFGGGEVSLQALNDTADYYDPANKPLRPAYPPPQYPPATGLAAQAGLNDIGGESLGSILANAKLPLAR